jgi:hypothetical protein
MKRIWTTLVVIITLLLLTGGFFLPSLVAGVEDKQIIGKLNVTGTQSISFENKPELGNIDRLKMRPNSSSIALDKGKNMDSEEAFECAVREIEKFNQFSVMDIDLTKCVMTDSDVEFLIDATDPSKSVIVWNLLMRDEAGHSVFLSVDDETGLITYLYYFVNLDKKKYELSGKPASEAVPEPEKTVDAGKLNDSIAAYYGLQIETVSSKSDRYNDISVMILKLSDGEDNVEMAVETGGYGFYLYVIS